jgi:hypothetical protein
MKKVILFLLFTLPGSAWAQFKYGDATVAMGDSQGTFSVLYGNDWNLGKRKKFSIGIGGRITSYLGRNQYYETAPAKITSEAIGPLVIFKETIAANVDSFLIESPQVNSLNVFINLRYAFTDKLSVGFNIDALGFSFGGEKSGRYINGSEIQTSTAKPTGFNALLISDNDIGSLNSEFYGRYYFNENWALKAAAQFHFTEYTTETEVQQFPEPNDRFRRKSLMFAIGISRKL